MGILDITIYFSYHIPGQCACRPEANDCGLNPHYTPLNRRASNNRSLRTISWSTVLSALCLKRLHCAQLVTKHVVHKFLNLPERLGSSSHAISDTKGAYPSMVIYTERKDNTVPSSCWKRNSSNVNRWGLTLKLMTPLRTTQVKQKCQKCQVCFS